MQIKKGDILIAAVIAVSALLLFVFAMPNPPGSATAVISQHNQEIRRIELSQLKTRETLNIDAPYSLVIEAEPGSIRFLSATCPDQVCVNTGSLKSPGDIAACLPSGVLIRLEGDRTADDLDVILR